MKRKREDDNSNNGSNNNVEEKTGGTAPPKKKRQGRRKINIEYIDNKSRRQITFSKRKAGLMKKAYEITTLTGTQALLLIASETGHVYTFATPKLQPFVTLPEGKNLIQSCLNAPDEEPEEESEKPEKDDLSDEGDNEEEDVSINSNPPEIRKQGHLEEKTTNNNYTGIQNTHCASILLLVGKLISKQIQISFLCLQALERIAMKYSRQQVQFCIVVGGGLQHKSTDTPKTPIQGEIVFGVNYGSIEASEPVCGAYSYDTLKSYVKESQKLISPEIQKEIEQEIMKHHNVEVNMNSSNDIFVVSNSPGYMGSCFFGYPVEYIKELLGPGSDNSGYVDSSLPIAGVPCLSSPNNPYVSKLDISEDKHYQRMDETGKISTLRGLSNRLNYYFLSIPLNYPNNNSR